MPSGNAAHRSLSLQYRSRVAWGGRVCRVCRVSMESTRYRERLIDEVKKYPVLYDTKHEQHRDIDVRDRCWLEISERLGANSESLKREWKILRDSMRQAIKRSKQGARTKAGTPCKRWRFQSRMAFVLPYITMRERRGIKSDIKLDESEIPSDLDQTQSKEPEIWDPGHVDHDALDLFFASVCQSTKRLPKKYQNIVKRHVLDTLLRAEDDFEAEQGETKLEVTKNFSEMV